MEKKKVFVLPGEIAVTKQPAVIGTLLGSCVAICLYNKKLAFGGMNHYMLPDGNNAEMKGKYGVYSTTKLVEMMLKFDPVVGNLEAQIYGGGAVVGHLSTGIGIGNKNIEVASVLMKKYGIRVAKRDVGGTNGRKIFFDTTTGDVQMRIIEKSELTQQLEEKKKSLSGRKIRILVVDDSSTIRQIIRSAIAMDSELEVIGEAADPYEAREKVLELDPDVITLDIIMPKMDGITFLKKLMLYSPKPVIVVSSVAQRGSKQRLRAESIGAIDVIDKEDLQMYRGLNTASSILSQKIKTAAVVHVKKKTKEEIGHI